jgi:hypothetical protein
MWVSRQRKEEQHNIPSPHLSRQPILPPRSTLFTASSLIDSPLVAIGLLVPRHLHIIITLVLPLFPTQGSSGLGERLTETVDKLLTPVCVDEGNVVDDEDVVESGEHIELIPARSRAKTFRLVGIQTRDGRHVLVLPLLDLGVIDLVVILLVVIRWYRIWDWHDGLYDYAS